MSEARVSRVNPELYERGPRKWAGEYDKAGIYFTDKLLVWGLQHWMLTLDIGCGPLRVGRWLIPYLDVGCYYGLEPEESVVSYALRHELPLQLVAEKSPRFFFNADFNVSSAFVGVFDMAFATDVFNHLGARQLEQCLQNVHARQIILNVHIADQQAVWEKDGTGWSYEHADYAGYAFTREQFVKLADQYGYEAEFLEVRQHPPKEVPPAKLGGAHQWWRLRYRDRLPS